VSLLGDGRSDKVNDALSGVGVGIAGEIENLGTFGIISPWTLAFDFDPSVTAQIAAQGGAAVALQIGGGPLGATIGNVTGPFTVALMWDDEKIGIVQTAQEGTNLVLVIGPPPPGAVRLSVWLDSVVPVSPGPVLPPDQAAAIAKQLPNTAAPSITSTIADTITNAAGKLVDLQQNTLQTIIVVGGLVVLGYFLFSGPIDRLAAKAAAGAA